MNKNKIESLIIAALLLIGALSVRYLDRMGSAEVMTGRGTRSANISLADLADTIEQRLTGGGESY